MVVLRRRRFGSRTLLTLGLVVLAGGCGTKAESTSDAACPAHPEVPANRLTSMIWPNDAAADLVPEFTDVCATPTAQHLFLVLNENAAWASELEMAALGILHREGQEVATFRVARVSNAAKLRDAFPGDAGTTSVGGLTLAWGGAGDHVVVTWLDGNDLVDVSAEGAEAAAAATRTWLRAVGHEGDVAAPEEIPEVAKMPLALGQGPPVNNLPEGYSALVVNPLAFMASDFADAVTIHEDKSVKALGAAIIVSEEGTLVGTVVAGSGTEGGLSEQASQTGGSGARAVVWEGFHVSDTDALVVGYDREEVTSFTTAWEQAVAG